MLFGVQTRDDESRWMSKRRCPNEGSEGEAANNNRYEIDNWELL